MLHACSDVRLERLTLVRVFVARRRNQGDNGDPDDGFPHPYPTSSEGRLEQARLAERLGARGKASLLVWLRRGGVASIWSSSLSSSKPAKR